MKEHVTTLHLSFDHAGQMLDGIRCREEAYRQTAEYLNSGKLADPYFVCEEVKDAEEARNLAATYQEIIESLEQQLRVQKK